MRGELPAQVGRARIAVASATAACAPHVALQDPAHGPTRNPSTAFMKAGTSASAAVSAAIA